MQYNTNSSALGDYWTQTFEFDDPFLSRLSSSDAVTRLKDIGFLGAIDYVRFGEQREESRQYYNRYEHSLGVASLAEMYSRIKELPEHDSRVLTSAGLLHDIGHGPLSHTLEPIFKTNYGVSHHKVGRDILFGQGEIGAEVAKIFSEYKVDIDEVVAMIEGEHDGSHAFLFSSPINVDTLDGICRAKKFADVEPNYDQLDPRRYLAAMLGNDDYSTEVLDEFWIIKHEVYNKIIYSCDGLLFDGLAQAYMHQKLDKFSAEDFTTTESTLRESHPELFEILNFANDSFKSAFNYIKSKIPELLNYTHRAPTREFRVEVNIEIKRPNDLKDRYVQTKAFRDVNIADLLAEELH